MECLAMYEPTSRDLLGALVEFPTVSRDSNLALIGFIQRYLADLGVQSELLHNAEAPRPTCSPPSARATLAASSCQGIRTWFPWTGRPGPWSLFASPKPMAACMAGARPT
jgi:acetylornithine deacetylase/succinyl-diaminopimelate desuccinylase-like protein